MNYDISSMIYDAMSYVTYDMQNSESIYVTYIWYAKRVSYSSICDVMSYMTYDMQNPESIYVTYDMQNASHILYDVWYCK